MKKLLSVVLVLAMLASMCIYLPMGVSATELAATPIYAEDFADMDGTYTLGELADLLGWTLLRGDDAATAVIADGKLTVTAGDLDVVFEMATSAAFKANHTYQFDLVMGTYSNKLYTATIYTGTDDGETATFIQGKTSYEGYNHLALANGVINESPFNSKGYVIQGGSFDQCRPENIPNGTDGSGYGAANNTWKTVVDATNNQIDVYAAGARINSTANADFKGVEIAPYLGEGAYLRVQKGCVATFDNISFVTGGEAIVNAQTGVIFNQDFSAIPDGTYTGAELAALTGFQTFVDTTAVATMGYQIKNGRLEIVANGTCTNSYTFKNNPQFATLYLPEAQAANTLVIEYEMTYLHDGNVTGSANSGDAPFGMEMYGRRSDFHAFWQVTQKGFPAYGFYKGAHTVDGTSYSVTQNGTKTTNGYYPQSQGRWEDTAFNAPAATYRFSNGDYGHSIVNSTEKIKVVMDVEDGFYIYINDVLAIQLSQTGLEAWTSTLGGGTANDIIGNLLRFRMPAGCYVALDNFKVTVDPEKVAGPDLWLTEASCGVEMFNNSAKFTGSEYVEVYNASTEAINIYDYALTQRPYSNSCDNVGTAIGLDNITLMYPGTHTFKSIKTDEITGLPLYTMDVTNPAYEDGWIEPGEVVVLWNKTDSMHNGGFGAPTVITDDTKANFGMGNFGHKTVADFRAALNIADDVKVFQMYNDYNRAFNNSGSHIVALVERDLVQPNYDPATGTGDEALVNASIGWNNYASTLLDVTADTNSGRTVKTVTYASYDVTEAIGYSSVVFARPDSAVDATGMTPGYLKNSQKKAFTVTVDGSAKAAYLGEDYTYAYDETSTAAPKFYKELFAVVDGDIVMADDPAYGTLENITSSHTVQRYKVAMTTVPGVGIRFGGQNDANWEQSFDYSDAAAGLRWVTGIKASHIDQLMNSGLVANVEIGTLITRDGAEFDETAKKVTAYNGYWFSETADANYADMTFFAGSVANMYVDNYERDYKGVGYVTVTMTNGDTVTVTGDYVDANESNVLAVIEAAQMDPENGLTPEEMDVLNEYYAQYYGE